MGKFFEKFSTDFKFPASVSKILIFIFIKDVFKISYSNFFSKSVLINHKINSHYIIRVNFFGNLSRNSC